MTKVINVGEGYRQLERWERPDKRFGDESRAVGGWQLTSGMGRIPVASAGCVYRRPIDRDPWLGCKPIEGWGDSSRIADVPGVGISARKPLTLMVDDPNGDDVAGW